MAGQPFFFGVEAPPQEDGNTVFVLLSGAEQEDGIPLPGSAGLTVDLRPDALFDIGAGLLPFLSAATSGGVGQTSTLTIPTGLAGLEIFYAGVSLDLSQGQYVAASPAHSFAIQ